MASLDAGTDIYKFGNNTYPRRIRRRSNLGHIFREKSASYGPGNTVYFVNLYTFREYLGPSSGGTTVCIQQLVLIILFR